MVAPLIIAAGIAAATSVGTAVYQNAQNKKAANAQKDIMMSNAENQYAAETFNALKDKYVSEMNIRLLNANLDLEIETNNASILANASLIQQTQEFNDLLYEQGVIETWTSANLDLELLGYQRARERGAIIANQGASGTVIGEGSNRDVVVDQMTQEALDKYIIKVGADQKVRDLTNARLQSKYQADMEIKKLAYEGRIENRNAILSTKFAVAEEKATAGIDYVTNMALATMGYTADSDSADNIYDANNAKSKANLTAGLIGAAGTMGSAYFNAKAAGTDTILTKQFDASADHKGQPK
jgi:hypothetical protein